MRIGTLKIAAGLVIGLASLSGCGKKLCDEVPTPAEGKEFVLTGGRVCKADGGVLTVDYPSLGSKEEVSALYKKELGAKGWKVEEPKSDGVIFASKGQDISMIVTLVGKDRGQPTAVVKIP